MRLNSVYLNQIQKAAEKLAYFLHPKKIVLFGSYAYGTPTNDSDVDLLIVVDDKENCKKIALKASELLYPRPFPTDIIVRSANEIKKDLKDFDPFLEEIFKRGKTLYEA